MPELHPVVRLETDAEVERGDFGRVTWRTLISADRTPTAGLVLGVAEIPAGDDEPTRRHRHAPPETYFVLNGRGIVTIDDADHSLRPGSAVFVPSNAWQIGRAHV